MGSPLEVEGVNKRLDFEFKEKLKLINTKLKKAPKRWRGVKETRIRQPWTRTPSPSLDPTEYYGPRTPRPLTERYYLAARRHHDNIVKNNGFTMRQYVEKTIFDYKFTVDDLGRHGRMNEKLGHDATCAFEYWMTIDINWQEFLAYLEEKDGAPRVVPTADNYKERTKLYVEYRDFTKNRIIELRQEKSDPPTSYTGHDYTENLAQHHRDLLGPWRWDLADQPEAYLKELDLMHRIDWFGIENISWPEDRPQNQKTRKRTRSDTRFSTRAARVSDDYTGPSTRSTVRGAAAESKPAPARKTKRRRQH